MVSVPFQAKQKIGGATGDPDLKAEGRADEASGKVQSAVGGVQRKVGEVIERAGKAVKK